MPRARWITASAILLTAAVLAAGCSEDRVAGPGPDIPDTRLADNVVVIDSEPGLSLYDIGEDWIVLRRTKERGISPGEVMIGSAGGGFIRTARRIGSDGEFLYIETDPAWLGSAVIRGGAERVFRLGYGSDAASGGDPAGAAFVPGDTLAAMPASGIDLSGIVLFSDPEAEGAPIVRIERGRAAISPHVGIELTVLGRSIDRLMISVEGEFDVEMAIHALLPRPVDRTGEIRVATIRTSGKMMIGSAPIPVVLTMDIVLEYSIEGYVTDVCDAAYSGSHDISCSILYDDDEWKFGDPASGPVFGDPSFECGLFSDCDIRVAARAVTRVSFFSADEAEFSFEPFISIGAETVSEPVWHWRLSGGLSISRSFAPGIMDLRLPAESAPALADSSILASGPLEDGGLLFVTGWDGSESLCGPLDQPRGVAAGQDGRVYVTDQNNHRVAVFDRLGGFIGDWGGYGTSPGYFLFPTGIDVASDGTVLVADSGNHRVQRFTADGDFLGQWGEMGTGDGQFVQMEGLAAGPDSLISVCDSGTNTFSIFTVGGVFKDRVPAPSAMGAAYGPASSIFVAGCYYDGIAVFDRDGQPLEEIPADTDCPIDLDVDGQGHIYLLDYALCQLIVLDGAGSQIARLGSQGGDTGQFDHPEGLAVSGDGLVYVADTFNNRIQVYGLR